MPDVTEAPTPEFQAAVLLGVMAHDLNNVLQGIATALDLIRALDQSPRTAEYISVADSFVERGSRSLRQMLEWIVDGRRFDIVELGQLVLRGVLSLQQTLPATVMLTTLMDCDEAKIRGAPTELEELVSLLVDNAVEAIGGRGRIELAVTWAKRSGLPQEKFVELSVKDDGPGMTEEVLAHCVEPFFSTRTARQALGLGLSIARGIVMRHSGRLSIVSTPGQGTRVTASFPAGASSPSVSDRAAAGTIV